MSETITSSVTGPITLTSGAYPGPLSITSTGRVTGQSYGVAIELNASSLSNAGQILGGTYGGAGVAIDGGILHNTGRIIGGSGGIFGGIGVSLQYGGAFTNNGLVQGGGGDSAGGAGVSLNDAATLTNRGAVTGGGGTEKSGPGVNLTGASTVINDGVIDTAQSVYISGDGIDISGAGAVINAAGATIAAGQDRLYGGFGIYGGGGGTEFINNAGIISGGEGELYGGAGIATGSLGTVVNTGSIFGGLSTEGVGGEGVSLSSGATLSNGGVIHGGENGPNYVATPGEGTGVFDNGAGVSNSGLIVGGQGYNYLFDHNGAYSGGLGGAAGAGLVLEDGTLTNAAGGVIAGGAGGAGYRGGGGGGTGIYAYALSGSISNSGIVRGGAGGLGFGGAGSAGAAGIELRQGLDLTVTGSGTIIGGAGGYSDHGAGGNGGDGVDLNGGTLALTGTVAGAAAGGQPGTLGAATASAGYAVNFGSIAGELILGKGAVLLGGIAGFGAGDTIDLSSVLATSESFSKGILTLFENGAVVDTLTLASSVASGGEAFTLKSDGAGGTDILATNLATVGLSLISGPGKLTANSATHLTLNLGTVTKGSVAPRESIGIENTAKMPADLLKGTLALSGTTGAFTNNGAISFTGVAAGSESTGHTISLHTGTIGTFAETIVLSPTDYNSSGFTKTLPADTLVVVGTVVAAGAAVGVASPAVMSFAASPWLAAATVAPDALLTGDAYAPASGGSLPWGMFAATPSAMMAGSTDFFAHGLTAASAAGDATSLGLGVYDLHKAPAPAAWAAPTLAS